VLSPFGHVAIFDSANEVQNAARICGVSIPANSFENPV